MKPSFSNIIAYLVAATVATCVHANPLPSLKESTIEIFGDSGLGQKKDAKSDENGRTSNQATWLKAGNSLIGASALLPVVPLSSGILFSELGGGYLPGRNLDALRGSKKVSTSLFFGHAALGYRHLFDESFFMGGYAALEFVSLPKRFLEQEKRTTLEGNNALGWGVGAELQYGIVRLSGNLYLPVKAIKGRPSSEADAAIQEKQEEANELTVKGASSADFRLQTSLPNLPWMEFQVGGEYFFKPFSEHKENSFFVDGKQFIPAKGALKWQAGVDITPIPLISISYGLTHTSGIYGEEKQIFRDHIVGLKLQWRLSQPLKHQLSPGNVAVLRQVWGGLVQPLNRHKLMSIALFTRDVVAKVEKHVEDTSKRVVEEQSEDTLVSATKRKSKKAGENVISDSERSDPNRMDVAKQSLSSALEGSEEGATIEHEPELISGACSKSSLEADKRHIEHEIENTIEASIKAAVGTGLERDVGWNKLKEMLLPEAEKAFEQLRGLCGHLACELEHWVKWMLACIKDKVDSAAWDRAMNAFQLADSNDYLKIKEERRRKKRGLEELIKHSNNLLEECERKVRLFYFRYGIVTELCAWAKEELPQSELEEYRKTVLDEITQAEVLRDEVFSMTQPLLRDFERSGKAGYAAVDLIEQRILDFCEARQTILQKEGALSAITLWSRLKERYSNNEIS